MRYPPRLAHLATRPVVIAKLLPTYVEAHHLDEDEAQGRLDMALKGPLLDDLLEATWKAMLGGTKRLNEDGLLEKVAKTLGERPLRPGKVAALTPALSAFLLLADLAAGTATDSAARVMESDQGQKMAQAGIAAAGAQLAAELTRGK